ncbi:MAG: hypothetical protein COA78_07610 [Blastopirellula sp.]|nr:MAG: hypothetical protein COA78_07610 [Blastopirellula sp.]
MLSIGTTQLMAQVVVDRNLGEMLHSMQRLATGKRVNSGRDDPAGLIAGEQLRSELTALDAAMRTNERARRMVQTADSGLSQVSRLTREIRGNLLTAASSTTSKAEQAALQIEIDAATEAINRIGSYTQFAGRKLLDGQDVQINTSTNPSDLAAITLPTVRASALGNETGTLADLRTGGKLDLSSGTLVDAFDVVSAVEKQIAFARAELGAFDKYTVDSTQNVLQAEFENLSAARSGIIDTDYASETSALARGVILAEISVSIFKSAGIVERAKGQLLDELTS